LIYNPAFGVTSQVYTITVGNGGAGAPANVIGNNGSNSVFGSLTAIGGGGGSSGNPISAGGAGGSGIVIVQYPL
jgi:hypothetical protein